MACLGMIHRLCSTEAPFRLKKFTQYLSHRILRHMHGVLNIDEKKLIVQLVRNRETKLLNLISP